MNKILVIRLSSLGDIVLTEPTCRKLKDVFPDSEITYITKPLYKKTVENFSGTDRVILWENKAKLLASLKKENFDLVIDLHDKFSSYLIKLFSGSKKVTYDKKHFLRKMMTKHMTNKEIYSVVDLYASIFDKLKINYSRKYPKLIPDSESKQKINEIFLNFGINRKETLIGIFPGASFNTKRYPISYLIKFISLVPESWNCRFILMGSRDDKAAAVEIHNSVNKKTVDFTGLFKIHELIGVMNELDGFITNDSGPMHIAAALNKPQIAIFGSTHTKLGFRPLNDNAIIVETDTDCRPCHLHGREACPKGHFRCMTEIKPGRLFNEFKKFYEKNILGV